MHERAEDFVETIVEGPPDEVPHAQAMEKIVSAAWRKTLGKRTAGRAVASVLDMRTGSRPVYRLLGEIENAIGLSLPFSVIFQAPTVAALTEVVAQGRPPAFEPLVAFRQGGSGPGLFIFPGIGGSLFQLFDLARAIDHSGTIYLNQQAGLDGVLAPHATIAEMAAYQVEQIRRRQASGPFVLLGYSLGALMALEVGRLLLDAGEAVPFIGLIEPGLPEAVWPMRVRLAFLARRVRHHIAHARSLRPRASLAYLARRSMPTLGRLGRMSGTQAFGKSAYAAEPVHPDLSALIDASSGAYHRYRPRPFARKAQIFRSEGGDPLDCDPLTIWPRWLGDFDLCDVPGDHKTMLHGGNVIVLAARVSQAVRAALG